MLINNAEGYGDSFGSYVGIWFEGIILILIIFLLMRLFKIYKITKFKMSLHLFYGFLFYALSVVFSWIDKWYFWKYKFYIINNYGEYLQNTNFFLVLIFSFRLSMIMFIIGNYFLASFFKTIYSQNLEEPNLDKKLILIKIVEIIAIILTQVYVYFNPTIEMASLTTSISFLILLLDSLFFLPNSYNAFKFAKQDIFGKKYKSIGIMGLLIINVIIMFLIDRITIFLGILGPFGELGYTFFYFSAWISVVLALITAIYGFIKR